VTGSADVTGTGSGLAAMRCMSEIEGERLRVSTSPTAGVVSTAGGLAVPGPSSERRRMLPLRRLKLEIWRRRRLGERELATDAPSWGESDTRLAPALGIATGSATWVGGGGVSGPAWDERVEMVEPERARTWPGVCSTGAASLGSSLAGSVVSTATGSSVLGAPTSCTASELGVVDEPRPDLRGVKADVRMLRVLLVVEAESRVLDRDGTGRSFGMVVVGDAGRGELKVKARVGDRKLNRFAGGVLGADMAEA